MVLKQHGATREQPPRLLVLLMEGCSGSTFVTQTASQLLECAGTKVVAAGELMKPRSANGWWNDYHNWSLALEVMHRDAGEFGKAFIINTDIKSGSSPAAEWWPTIRNLGGRIVEGHRRNRLDMMLCMIRDCFGLGPRMGYLLDEHGNRSNLCFARRGNSSTAANRVHLDLHQLQRPSMRKWSDDGIMNNAAAAEGKEEATQPLQLHAEALAPLGVQNMAAATYEDLAAFQYPGADSSDELMRSLVAWQKLMAAWGVTHFTGKSATFRLRECLRRKLGTYKRPPASAEMIDNYKQALPVLARLGLTKHLRNTTIHR